MKQTCYIAADHAGYDLKKQMLAVYPDMINLGTDSSDAVDYPDFAKKLADQLERDREAFGILVCGSGVGIDIAANKIDGIRAGTISESEQARASVHDENLNVISLSADFLSENKAIEIARAFLESKYGKEERYERRLEEIKDIEAGN